VAPLRLVVWSDYLCPWCYNASVRLTKLQQEFGNALEVEWRAFLLRPEPRTRGDREAELHRFVRYTQSWLRPASEPDAGNFRVWESGEGPPSHSVPAHLAAKAALRLGREAFAALHPLLLRAYFAENRDISARPTLDALWREAGLPAADFAACDDPALLRTVRAEHADALEQGATGVPAAKLADQDAILLGALPLETYRRWVLRHLEREPDGLGAA
jgi:predicted DsbA family dithiol-disulfide isomerase